MDYAAYHRRTPILPEVASRMREVAPRCFNPSSQHQAGQGARRLLEEAGEDLRESLGAGPDWKLIWTASTQEADQLVCNSVAAEAWVDWSLASGLKEAPFVWNTWPSVHGLGWRVGEPGWDLESVGAEGLVILQAVNVQLGLCLPVKATIAALRKAGFGGWIHVSGEAWALGGLGPDRWIASLGADSVSVASACVGGPPEVAALLARPGLSFKALWGGGAQQRGERPGTEPVLFAVAMAEALKIAQTKLADFVPLPGLALAAGVRWFGETAPSWANVIDDAHRQVAQSFRSDFAGVASFSPMLHDTEAVFLEGAKRHTLLA